MSKKELIFFRFTAVTCMLFHPLYRARQPKSSKLLGRDPIVNDGWYKVQSRINVQLLHALSLIVRWKIKKFSAPASNTLESLADTE